MKADANGRALVLGASGQVGRALRRLLGPGGVYAGRERVDFAWPQRVRASLARLWDAGSPDVVINAAAYTDVDRAERDRETAWSVNVDSVLELARWCRDRDVPLVHFSTDYVYAGHGSTAWTEAAPGAPVNAYGRSKLAGDQAVMAIGGRYLILRTSWIYDAEGRNFLRTILRLGAEREELSVVDDQVGAPTYAAHLARAALEAVRAAVAAPGFPTGVYHLCAAGETTWHGFAVTALQAAAARGVPLKVARVRRIATSEYRSAAQRPLNSRLDTTKAARALGVTMPAWQAGLEQCLDAMVVEARQHHEPMPVRVS